MILLEEFLVKPIISLTKNPSRRIIISLGLSRKIGPKSAVFLLISDGLGDVEM